MTYCVIVLSLAIILLDCRRKSGLKFLSNEIIKNRVRISELKTTITKLEVRVWDLEGHTPEETLQELERRVGKFSKAVGDCGDL